MFFILGFVSKLLNSKPGKNAAAYREEQNLLLQQLKEAPDHHTRQLILDKMMVEDLLHAADLSNTMLRDIHLERANLEHADLCGAALPEADLVSANLQHASLSEADLTHADLVNANLSQAELSHIQLDGAALANVNLDGAHLPHASLRDASLYEASLNGACLDHADLRGCCLVNADLEGASLYGALFDETTVLPDSEYWTPIVDMQRYTDASHPDHAVSGASDAPTFQAALLAD